MLSNDDKAAMLDAIAAYAHATPFEPEIGSFVMDMLDESPYGLPKQVRQRRAAVQHRREANDRGWRV